MLWLCWVLDHGVVIELFLVVVALDEVLEWLSDYIGFSLLLPLKVYKSPLTAKQSLSVSLLIIFRLKIAQLTFWQVSGSLNLRLVKETRRWSLSRIYDWVILSKIHGCWYHREWFTHLDLALDERFHWLSCFHLCLLILLDEGMLFAKFVFNILLVLIFLLLGKDPSWALRFGDLEVWVVNVLSFAIVYVEAKVTAFLPWHWFEEIILVLFFRWFSLRRFVSFWFFIVWCTYMIQCKIVKFGRSWEILSCWGFNFHWQNLIKLILCW